MRFVDANNVQYEPNKYLTYDDVLLIPKRSDISSRNDPSIQTKTNLTPRIAINVPFVSANMDTITGSQMAIRMAQLGGIGILHRFYPSFEDWQKEIDLVIKSVSVPVFSIGLDPKYKEWVDYVTEKSVHSIVCIDVAHGHMQSVLELINKLRSNYTNLEIIAGNVATAGGVADLISAGASSIKIGIGCGQLCSTRVVTGHGVPQITAIMHARRAINAMQSNATLIADGGIRSAGDIVKALAAGADTVMLGGLLAGTMETPGPIYKKHLSTNEYRFSDVSTGHEYENIEYKKYRGQASADFMQNIGKSGVSAEGVHKYVKVKGTVDNVFADLLGGLRSGMSYSGVRDLGSLNRNAYFIEISQNAHIEGTPHGLNE